MPPDEFWKYTLREVVRISEAHVKRLMREHNDRMTHAWITVGMGRAKRMPKLETLHVNGKKKAPQTSAQQIAIARMWAALGYGKIGRA